MCFPFLEVFLVLNSQNNPNEAYHFSFIITIAFPINIFSINIEYFLPGINLIVVHNAIVFLFIQIILFNFSKFFNAFSIITVIRILLFLVDRINLNRFFQILPVNHEFVFVLFQSTFEHPWPKIHRIDVLNHLQNK